MAALLISRAARILTPSCNHWELAIAWLEHPAGSTGREDYLLPGPPMKRREEILENIRKLKWGRGRAGMQAAWIGVPWALTDEPVMALMSAQS